MRRTLPLLATLAVSAFAFADEHGEGVFVPAPGRPFLLVDARRRYQPQERAHAYVQRRGGGALRLALFRVHDARAFVDASVSSQGVSTANGPWGESCEALLRAGGPLPRRDPRLTLLQERTVQTVAQPAPRTAVGDETAAYDSNEQDEGAVETWGVSARGWGVADVDLGPLAVGTYLVRAQDGMYATSALLSVGEAVVLLRRGDARDLVRVSDGEGRGLAGLRVESGEAHAVTDDRGEAVLPASDAPTRRVYVARGDELAWVDVLHTGLSPCDTRVYLATGRPVYRPGEEVKVRGHVRGCGPIAGARVRVFPTRAGDEGEAVTTDGDGNFSATLLAAARIGAEHEGRVHARTLSLDARAVPQSTLRVRFDRAWASAGDRVTVTASAEGAGELQSLHLSWPGGAHSASLRPGQTVSTELVMPASAATLERFTVRATAVGTQETVHARASLWTGRHRELLTLTPALPQGAPGEPFALTLAARDLGGEPAPGTVRLAISGSDGNRPQGAERWSGEVAVGPSGAIETTVRLPGQGPWWVRAARGEAVAETAVWERPRPPTLGAGGGLALLPAQSSVGVGERLEVALRAAGPTWVTLEQGGVWWSELITPPPDGRAVFHVDPPDGARGLATLVATRVHQGRVETATAVTEVATSQRFALSLEPERTSLTVGQRARVIVRARTIDGRPRPAVLSMWLEDAGWWGLGEDRHPSVDAYFRATGRPASGGDSSRPLGFGSEEGRRVDCGMFWNGERVPGTSFRHAWGHGGAVISLRARGDLNRVADAVARGAGLMGATMCPARVRPAGTVDLELRELPWDLAAAKLAERTSTWVRRVGERLRFDCAMPAGSIGALGSGSGRGMGGGSVRGGSPQTRDRDQLAATQWFLAARRIPAEGVLDVTVPMPDAPGRWRLHALAIADDGAGAEADAELDTVQPVTATLSLGRALAAGDAAEFSVRVHRSGVAPAGLALAVRAEGAASVEGGAAAPLQFDAHGDAQRTFRLRALRAGDARVSAVVSAGAAVVDAVSAGLSVRDDHAEQTVDYRAAVHADATDVDLPIPPLAAPATLTVELDPALATTVSQALASLRAPRWHVGALRLDRYASLRALEAAAARLRGEDGTALRRTLSAELQSAAAELRAVAGSDGAIAWWTQVRGDPSLTATALALGADDQLRWPDAWSRVRDSAPIARGALAARVAAALARGRAADRALVPSLLLRVDATDAGSLAWAVRAAQAAGDGPGLARLAPRLAEALDREASQTLARPCAGPAWFLCLAREGSRGELAFAARVLLEARPAARAAALRVARWLSAHPQELTRWGWGSAEADVLALLAALDGGSLSSRAFAVRMGDETLATSDGRGPLRVTVREAGTLRLSFSAAAGRFTRVSVRGVLRVAPPTQGVGTAALERRVEGDGERRTMVLTFDLPRDAADLELHAPLPAALELAAGAEDPVSQRFPTPDGRELDGPVGDQRARVTRLDDGVRVRFDRLRAGRHSVRVPLVVVSRGEFFAGSAWLRAREPEVWAVTPALRAALR